MDESLRAAWSKQSWIESANDPANGFPLQSLPHCVFATSSAPRIGVRIGEFILDLAMCSSAGVFRGLSDVVIEACKAQILNPLIACGRAAHSTLRARLIDLFNADAAETVRTSIRGTLVRVQDVRLLKPVEPPDYTDFYASIHHAQRVGQIFRPEQPLLPNYKFVPVGYHGRASSIVVSGTAIRRPCGQTKPASCPQPSFEPTRSLDYEVELGIYVIGGNPLGERVCIESAADQVFGISLLNDWSARDIQAWEYQPLGPFLAKSFATSVSPWVVPLDALEPFRCASVRPAEDPAPLDYLVAEQDQRRGAIHLTVDAYLFTAHMREAGLQPQRLSSANLRDLYWTPAQLIAHHTSNGCNLQAADLLATGTISGPGEDAAGCLLELTTGGLHPVLLQNGESRTALEDGDEVILKGVCRRDGFPDVSMGDCRGMILPAKPLTIGR